MMHRDPIWIALSCRRVEAQGYHEPRDALSDDWSSWCEARGSLPLLLPARPGIAVSLLSHAAPRLLILTGGNDVVWRAEGSDFCDARNRAELAMLAWAEETATPVLGVCRGMHMINRSFGGEVQSTLAMSARHVGVDHPVRLRGILRDLAGTDLVVTNSYHSQGLAAPDVAPDLQVLGVCEEDGTVEALRHKTKPIFGIGWHPERANPAHSLDEALVALLLETSQNGEAH